MLYDTYQLKHRRFYLYWLIGFLSYGISNILHTYMRIMEFETEQYMLVLGAFVFLGFTGLLMGVSALTNKPRLYIAMSLSIPVVFTILYLTGYPVLAFSTFFLLPYLIITVVLMIISFRFKYDMNLLIFGWLLVLLANIGLAMGVLNMFTAPFFSLTGKSLVFFWITQPRFSLIAESFEDFITKPMPEPPQVFERIISVVETRSDYDTLEWIRERALSAEASGVRSILFLTGIESDDLEYAILDSLSNTYIFKVVDGYRPVGEVFSEHFMEISNDVSEISVIIYDILEYIRANEVVAQLFLYDVSFFIKRNGWRRVYSQMISLIPQFKTEDIRVNFVYNRDLIENKYIVEIIRHLADNVLELED